MSRALESLAETALSEERRTITSRVLDAPRALVWQAWTRPEHVARWWGCEGFEVARCELDPTPGGAFRLDLLGPDGTLHPCRGRFREVVEPERLVFEGDPDAGHPCGIGLPPGARVVVRFEAQGGKTRLTLETLFRSAAARQAAVETGYAASWVGSLERLAVVVARL